jgi:hypothetical protein
MAATVSIVNQPDEWAPVNKELWYKVDSGSSSISDFKYLFRIKKKNEPFGSTWTTLSTYKVPPSPEGYALFSPHQLLKSFFSYNINPFQQGWESGFVSSPNSGIPDGLVQYTINYGYEYNPSQDYYDVFYYNSTNVGLTFSSAHGLLVGDLITVDKTNKQINIVYNGTASVVSVPFPNFAVIDKSWSGVNTPNGTDGGTITSVIRLNATASTRQAFNGTRQYRERTRDFSEYVLGLTNSTNGSYQFLSPTGYVDRKFLRNYPSEYKPINYGPNSTTNEYETVSLIVATPSGKSGSIKFAMFNSAGVQQTSYSYNLPTNNLYRRLDVGVGTQNLSNSFGINWGSTNYDYYTVAYLQAGVTASEVLKYKLRSECSPYPANEWVRVLWLNRQGGFDYFTFTRDVKKSVSITRSEYQKILDWDYSVGDRGKTVFATKAEDNYTIQSNWITDNEAKWLEELMTSPEVYIIGNDSETYYSQPSTAYKLPIVITGNSYEVKTTLRDKMFNFVLTYKMSFNTNLQND